ncbi:MAG: DegV family protein, partial [Dehalococcoidia bacterium]
MPLRIVTDSTADLNEQEHESLGITVVPLTVFFGDQAYLDRVELDPPEFYERLRTSKVLPRTSQPSVGRFKEAYEHLAADGATEILSIHLSSKLSGTAGSARLAAQDPPPHCRMETLDSLTVAAGLAAIVRRAAEVAARGGGLDEALAAARAQMPRQQVHILLDTLEYLQRGGRIGRAKAWFGSMLNIKPIIRVQDGEVGQGERVRSRARGIDAL